MKNLKSNKLVSALIAAGAVSFAGFANAAALNPDGLGEVLVYPYYSVQNGNATLLSIVNTTNQGKVVKLRFREHRNSDDVRDFNIYLSAQDVWTGAVLALGATGVNGNGLGANGAAIYTQDNSCTAPGKAQWPFSDGAGTYGVHFSTSDYLRHDDSLRTTELTQTIQRATRGYFEVLEQATIPTGTSMYNAIDHRVAGRGGRPDCAALEALVQVNNQYSWASAGLVAPTGGLFGTAAYISTGNGASTAQSAVALNGFDRATGAGNSQVFSPGSERPAMWDAANTSAAVITPTQVVIASTAGVGAANGLTGSNATRYDAMLAGHLPLFATNVYGEYFYSNDLAGATDWVVTFPGKRHFTTFVGAGVTNPSYTPKQPADAFAPASNTTLPPFATSSFWRVTGTSAYTAPVPISSIAYDREERTITNQTPGCTFSPCDPADIIPGASLPFESNVIAFGPTGQSTTAASGALNADNALWLLGAVQTPLGGGGWLDLAFTSIRPVAATRTGGVDLVTGAALTQGAVTFNGLPVVGFQAGSAKSIGTGGVRDNYRHSSNLNYRKSVQ